MSVSLRAPLGFRHIIYLRGCPRPQPVRFALRSTFVLSRNGSRLSALPRTRSVANRAPPAAAHCSRDLIDVAANRSGPAILRFDAQISSLGRGARLRKCDRSKTDAQVAGRMPRASGPSVQEQSVLDSEAHQHWVTGTTVSRSRGGAPGKIRTPGLLVRSPSVDHSQVNNS